MRVYPISNENTNFSALKFTKDGKWDGKMMQEFVQSTEVQKFVKYWHDKGVDVVADGHGKGGIALFSDSSGPERFSFSIFSFNGGVKAFNAEKAIAEIARDAKQKIEDLPLIQEAQEFVSKFNRALNINSAWQKAKNEKNDAEFYKAFVDELTGISKA